MKRIYQNLLLALFSIFMVFIVMETTLRFLGYGNLIIYDPDPKLFWKPKANQNCYTKFGRKPVRVNSKGTRGNEFENYKPKNVFRIISLGDSKTFGWGLNESETYSSLLESSLQNFFGDSLHVEVINAGVNAWSYSQLLTYLKGIGITYNPDLVIVADANLWTQFSEHSSKTFVNKMMKQVWLKNLLRRSSIYHFFVEVKLQKVYYKYRKKFIPIDPKNDILFKEQQHENSYVFFEDNIRDIFRLLNEHNVKSLMLYIPHKMEVISDRKSMVLPIKQRVSAAYSVPLIDFTQSFRQYSKRLYLEGDPVHPNVEGNRIIAEEIFRFLTEELKRPTPFLSEAK